MADWKGVSYTEKDLLNMQQEAIRRVRQMQQRSRQTVQQANAVISPPMQDTIHIPVQGPTQGPGNATPNAPGPQAAGANHPSGGGAHSGTAGTQSGGTVSSLLSQLTGNLGIHLPQFGQGEGKGLGNVISNFVGEDSPIGKVLDALNIDNERLLLIGLLLLLMNEKADFTLLVALFYLLL
ncbi:hypothetical protein [Provencibacterium massiliense]|uniref:hypothetical protein n=1 Tax=Provencibacterium massiliense TaxID=1841868 RepID=UPI00117B77D7|nr:hypothetical protein [Provencibacterium massiliense]